MHYSQNSCHDSVKALLENKFGAWLLPTDLRPLDKSIRHSSRSERSNGSLNICAYSGHITAVSRELSDRMASRLRTLTAHFLSIEFHVDHHFSSHQERIPKFGIWSIEVCFSDPSTSTPVGRFDRVLHSVNVLRYVNIMMSWTVCRDPFRRYQPSTVHAKLHIQP